MAMVVSVSQLAGPAVNSALSVVNSFAKDKFHEILGVQNEIDSLSSNLTAMQAALKDGEKFLKDSDSESLLDWLTKLRSVSLDVEDVVATYATDTALWSKRGFPNPISWLCFKSKAANKIREITRMIDRISKEKDRFHFGGGHYASSSQTTWVGLRETTPSHDTHIFGRETEKEEIVGWLQSDEYNPEGEFPVVAITGMGGLGKTTLAQLVYNDERIHRKEDKTGYFRHAVWINVSGSFNVDRILKEMAEILTKMAHNLTFTEAIKEHIRRALEGRLLLVLDDVWPTDLDWKPLHDFLKSCPQGSKVVVTSRDAKVPSIMRAKHTKTLGILPREECWNLFAAEAFTSGEHPTELEMIGREIISKCDFLPLAVKSMASLLRGDTNKNRWERILKDGIWESDQPLLGNQKSNILPALKLSYDGLPSQLKQCFAYCCIFPKGYMFEKKELVNLWIAEGYIEARRSYKIEEVGRYYFDELQARSFFQLLDIDNKTRYNIHDLNHDLAIYVSSNCQQVTEDEASPIAAETRHLSFLGKDAQKLALGIRNAQKLHTLLLPTPHAKDFGQALDKMFRSLSYLRVLDLSSSTIQALPESIQELKLLSYLDLSRTEIRALPNTICNLYNLQILKLLQCLWLWSLPKDFGNLKNLRHLELDDMFWYKCTAFPPRIGCIANLHDLHAFHVRKESGYGVEQLQFLKNLEGVLHISSLENSDDAMSAKLKEKTSISGLVLEWSNKDAQPQESSMQERVLKQLEPHPGVQKLEINHFKGNQFPIWMGTLGNLMELSLALRKLRGPLSWTITSPQGVADQGNATVS